MKSFKSLGSIRVKGQLSKSLSNFKEDVEIALVELGLDSIEAEGCISQNQTAIARQFTYMTNVIEYATDAYQTTVKIFSKKIHKTVA